MTQQILESVEACCRRSCEIRGGGVEPPPVESWQCERTVSPLIRSSAACDEYQPDSSSNSATTVVDWIPEQGSIGLRQSVTEEAGK